VVVPRSRNHPELPSILQTRFTDRKDVVGIFERYLDVVDAPLPALMFYGIGGIGKSWLLRRMRREAQERWKVPSVLIDFTREQGTNPYLSDPLLFLADIRGITVRPCPRFDVAFALALVRRYRQDETALADKWKTTGLSAGWEVVKAIGGFMHPALGGTLSVVEKVYGALKDHALLTGLRESFLKDLEGLRVKDLSAIESELVWRLTSDLNAEGVLPARRSYRVARAIVFVDTLEALVPADLGEPDEERATSRLRDVITAMRGRVLFVLAGQNKLNWKFIHPDWEHPAWLEQHLLDGLSEPDARDFLDHCGIADPPVQQAILARCLRVKAAFHPASLGLFADIAWLEMREDRVVLPALFDEVMPGDMASLVRRFLKSLSSDTEQEWIRTLAVTPSFDQAAARVMYSHTWSQAQDRAWETLCGLSFLVPAPKRVGWFSIHSSVQDALRASETSVREYHERWRVYWASRPPEQAADIAWFHQWCLDPKSAREYWLAAIENARNRLDMSRQFALLDWWDATGISTRFEIDREDAASLNSLAREFQRCTLGDRAANLRQSIACCKQALQVYTREPFPAEWASTHDILGNAYSTPPLGDRAANLRKAIDCYRDALQVNTFEAFPAEWANTQNNLGIAYSKLWEGDRAANLRRAISYYQNALQIYTREAFPEDWAIANNNLSLAYADLPDGDRAANLRRAITCCQNALQIWTREAFPAEWARAQSHLGMAYADLPDGDRAENLRQAIACFQGGLQIYTREAFPDDWARVQNGLGIAYSDLWAGGRAANLRKAISCYQNALQVVTREAFGFYWACCQNNLGAAYTELPDGDRLENFGQAIACFRNALQIRTREAFPAHWAETQVNLGLAYYKLPDGDRTTNLTEAITFYQNALEVYTREAFPAHWARTQVNLGSAYSNLPDGDGATNLTQAITCYQNAMQVFTRHASPADWAKAQGHLGMAYADLPGDNHANLRQAMACYQNALEVYTREAFPADWAWMQYNRAVLYRDLPDGDRAKNLRQAIACYQGALQIYTRETFPDDWARVQKGLGIAYSDLWDGDRAANLRKAITCYENALQVYTREAFPADQATTNFRLARAINEAAESESANRHALLTLAAEKTRFAIDGFEITGNQNDLASARNLFAIIQARL
jgi:tetratricopeptide (TPR) repeat protein